MASTTSAAACILLSGSTTSNDGGFNSSFMQATAESLMSCSPTEAGGVPLRFTNDLDIDDYALERPPDWVVRIRLHVAHGGPTGLCHDHRDVCEVQRGHGVVGRVDHDIEDVGIVEQCVGVNGLLVGREQSEQSVVQRHQRKTSLLARSALSTDSVEIFFDRDPHLFAILLGVLRTGKLSASTWEKFDSQALIDEASYYGILEPVKKAMAPAALDGIDVERVSMVIPNGRDCPLAICASHDGSVWVGHDSKITATDFLSAALGLKKTLPAYLYPALTSQDLITGVCFAAAGSGFDNATAEGSAALTLWKQVQYFKSYKTALGKVVGDENASAIITNALFVCGTGVNDFMPNRRPLMRLDSYQDFLLQVVDNFIQELYSEGARRIAFMALPPMGCVPLVRTLALKQSPGKTVDEHGCLEDENQVAIDFNAKLKSKLAVRSDLKLIYLDMYSVSLDMIHNPKNYGLDITARGCCGTGLTELGPLCNQGSLTCPDASKYVFWDASHPTQKGYEILTQLVLIPGLA